MEQEQQKFKHNNIMEICEEMGISMHNECT
jgi:hypothetical protein